LIFEKAIAQNGAPETVTVDKSGANLAALHAVNAQRETPIRIRQRKYLNNIVEQDHRASNVERGQCWGSRIFGAHASLSAASRPCT
jgi:putative transposase